MQQLKPKEKLKFVFSSFSVQRILIHRNINATLSQLYARCSLFPFVLSTTSHILALIGCRSIQLRPEVFGFWAADKAPWKLKNELAFTNLSGHVRLDVSMMVG